MTLKAKHAWWITNKYWNNFENLFFVSVLLRLLYNAKFDGEKIKTVSCQFKWFVDKDDEKILYWAFIDDVNVFLENDRIVRAQCKLNIINSPKFIDKLFWDIYNQYKLETPIKYNSYYLVSRNIISEFSHFYSFIKWCNKVDDFIDQVKKVKISEELGFYDLYCKIEKTIFNINNPKDTYTNTSINELICREVYELFQKIRLVSNYEEQNLVDDIMTRWGLTKTEAKNLLAHIYYKSINDWIMWIQIKEEDIKKYLEDNSIKYKEDIVFWTEWVTP